MYILLSRVYVQFYPSRHLENHHWLKLHLSMQGRVDKRLNYPAFVLVKNRLNTDLHEISYKINCCNLTLKEVYHFIASTIFCAKCILLGVCYYVGFIMD